MSLLRRINKGDDGNQDNPQDAQQSPVARAEILDSSFETYPHMELKRHIKARILAKQDADTGDQNDDVKLSIKDLFDDLMEEESVYLSQSEREQLFKLIVDDLTGFGPLEPLIGNESISIIMVNDPYHIFVVHNDKLDRVAGPTFDSEEHLETTLKKLINLTELGDIPPLIEAYLPDGARLNALLPPVSRHGIVLTIRKGQKASLAAQDLIRFGTMTAQVAEFLRACVIGRLNILVTGARLAGKTSLLNVLGNFIPDDSRIVTLEDLIQLQLEKAHVVSLQSGAMSGDRGHPAISPNLVHQLLQLDPDYIMIDQRPIGDPLEIVQAMYHGYDGIILTVNADSPHGALDYLQTQSLLRAREVSEDAIRRQLASSVHLIVQIQRLRDGSRKITRITEVQGIEGEMITLSDIFEFEQTGYEAAKIIGQIRPTGIRPRFIDRIESAGLHLTPSVFGIGRTHSIQSAEKAAETVQFTAFHPKEVVAEHWYTLLVYTHLETVLNQVQTDAAKFSEEMAENPRKVASRQTAQLNRGTPLRVVVEGEGLEFKPKSATTTWDEDYERIAFRFRAEQEMREQAAIGEIIIYTGPVEIARIRFSIFVNANDLENESVEPKIEASLYNPLARAKMNSSTTQMYSKIFISYSRADTEFAKAYRLAQLAAGHDVFMDTESIRTGDDWQAALARAIDSADVFQLFWSKHSASSPNVRDEWDYALKHKCPEDRCAGFIRPVFWEKPLPSPPAELGHLNFRYVPLLGENEDAQS